MAKLSASDYEYRRAEKSVSSINYHFVFVPKRRKAVLVNEIAMRLQEIIFELVKEHGWRLIALEVMPDHVHMFINSPPHESASQIAKWVKGRASNILRKEYPQLKKLPTLWSPSYFVATTGQVSTDVIRKYIENQTSK
ncbi:transposase [Rivularia sp. PCC 7116]|uniref:IS200/IS605 family transposase n=1 Tax=Rivularia sp. PCC 7116 TaxID=373994 RepID=UPI00029F2185|nr:IS200/IS605 family transposase [Rivularia sp. PCC 7116]AFY54020.1 transposase [Rivularia sp. PCC 7116]AFY55235.1 transposase [Rivularia sp. PCC 7116]AFY55856.1 transposase [Rivularia sp. PCC 7116]AFY56480.1 transposase [Rivularia sp. PCC 7116]AFY56520.1 transposase [Rivularia sp. PCC 7116]